jgi:hypothetical protein
MRRSSILSRPKISPSPSAAPAPVAVPLRRPQTPPTPPNPSTLPTPAPQAAEAIATLIATVTVVVVAVTVVVVVVVGARSLMLAHGWMAVPNVARAGCVGKYPNLAFHGLRCRSRRSRLSWIRSITMSRRHEMMKTWKRLRLRLVQLMPLSQTPAQAWQQRLHHHPQPRAAAHPSSDFHHSRIHPHQPLCALLSNGTQGLERRWERRVYSFDLLFDGAFSFSFFSFSFSLCFVYWLPWLPGFPLKELPVDVGRQDNRGASPFVSFFFSSRFGIIFRRYSTLYTGDSYRSRSRYHLHSLFTTRHVYVLLVSLYCIPQIIHRHVLIIYDHNNSLLLTIVSLRTIFNLIHLS